MEARYFRDPDTGLPHIYNHGVTEAEVLQVLRKPGPVYRGERSSRMKSGQTEAGRCIQVVYSPDPGGRWHFRDYRVPAKRQSTQGISATTTEKVAMKKMSDNSNLRETSRRTNQKFPPGWNERKVRAVIKHYEELSDEQLAHEIESAPEVTEETLMSVPSELVGAVQKLIARHQKSA